MAKFSKIKGNILFLLLILIGLAFLLSHQSNKNGKLDLQSLFRTGYNTSPEVRDSSSYRATSLSVVNILSKASEAITKQKDTTFLDGPTKEEKSYVWWISNDNWNIGVNSSSITVKILPATSSEPNKETFRKLNNAVKKVMNDNNFSFNQRNSSNSESDTKFYDYVQAFENRSMVCVATSSPDLLGEPKTSIFYSSFRFDCFDNSMLQLAYAQQTPFLKALKNDLNYSDEILGDIKIKGDKAAASVGWRRTGAEGFFFLNGTTWKTITVTQAVESCDKYIKSNIPRQYWITCTQGSNVIKGWNESF